MQPIHSIHYSIAYSPWRGTLITTTLLYEGDSELLVKIEAALKAPVFSLFLGHRSCPPTFPLLLGIRDSDLETTLNNEPMLCDSGKTDMLRVQVETNDSGAGMLSDLPVTFNPDKRLYGYRKVKEYFIPLPDAVCESNHDPFSELG